MRRSITLRANELAKRSTKKFNQSPLFIEPASLAIGLHAGKGCVALAARIIPKKLLFEAKKGTISPKVS